MQLSDEQWRQKLTPTQYAVLRQGATEAPYSGEYELKFDNGIYTCAACGAELFDSATKFDAQCGWPSFYDAKPGTVRFEQDTSFGMRRTKVSCVHCGSHLGHVFEGEGFDTPTDKRYCVNSLSLQFTPKHT